MPSKPLVSIVVVTYNSMNFIEETLDSIKNQSYPYIELVISDDGSSDKTTEIVGNWLKKHGERFVKAIMLVSEENYGITKNCNKGIKSTCGDYIKLVAGDDVLFENCIEDLLDCCLVFSVPVVFSKTLVQYDNMTKFNEKKLIKQEALFKRFFNSKNKKQYKFLLSGFSVGYYIIGAMFSREIYNTVGGFDESYVMLDDYPFFLKISFLGYTFHLLEKVTAVYRMRYTMSDKQFKKSKRYLCWLDDLHRFEEVTLLPLLRKEKMFFSIFDVFIRRGVRKIQSGSNVRVFNFFAKLLLCFSPVEMSRRLYQNYAFLLFKINRNKK